MATSPWIITDRAVAEYCELRDWPVDREHGDSAERELRAIMELAHFVREQHNGLDLYRGPSPDRLRLLVGERRQVVSVLAGHDRAAGTGDAPAEQHSLVQLPKLPRSVVERWNRAAGPDARGPNSRALHRWIVDACNRAADDKLGES